MSRLGAWWRKHRIDKKGRKAVDIIKRTAVFCDFEMWIRYKGDGVVAITDFHSHMARNTVEGNRAFHHIKGNLEAYFKHPVVLVNATKDDREWTVEVGKWK